MASMEHGSKSQEKKDLPKLQSSNFAAGAETGGANSSDSSTGGDGDGKNRGDSFRLSDYSLPSRPAFAEPFARDALAESAARQSTPEHQKAAEKLTTGNSPDSGNNTQQSGEKG